MSTTVASALLHARQRGIDRLDAQWLLAHGLQCNRAWLIAHDEVDLPATVADEYERLLARRAAGEPLAYLLGQKEFYGLMLQVDARVLVPRPETELLVDWALELLRARSGASEMVDLGTGSGAIALALKHAHPGATVRATDTSDAALAVARDNASRLGLDIGFAQGSWWHAVPGRRFDLAVSNPPYIAGGDHHLPALRHEPLGALSPGPSGLEALETIVAQAPEHLLPGGWLLLEHGFDQAGAVQALLAGHGFSDVQTRADLAGQLRCTGARR